MEEKIIIEGKPSKKTSTMLLKVGLVLVVVGLLLFFLTVNSSWRMEDELYYIHKYGGTVSMGTYISCLGDCISFTNGPVYFVSVVLDLGILLSLYSLILWFSIKDDCVTVTNKRVYGVTKWGKRVDLPLNQISAVSTSWLKGIAVGTSSGRIVFKAIENYIDVHKEITNLMAVKQDIHVIPSATIKQEIPQSNADELKKFKELLDMGVITQEEFDAKKKQLLGL